MKKVDFMNVMRAKSQKTLTPEDENFLGAIGDALEEAWSKEAIERNRIISEQLDKLGQFDEGQTVSSIIRTLGAKIDELEAKSARLTETQKISIAKLIRSKEADIKKAMKNKTNFELKFVTRTAAAMMTTASFVTGTTPDNPEQFDLDMDIVLIKYPANFVIDAIGGVTKSWVKANIVKREQEPINGNISTVLESGEKTLVEYSFVNKTYSRKKYAGRIEFTEELENDFEQLIIDVTRMFEDQVIRDWNKGVLADLIAWIPAYTTTAIDGTIPKPDIYSVIGAGIAHIQKFDHEPDVIFMNPQDVWAMNLTQDEQGNYKYNPLGGNYAGLKPFISNSVVAGNIYIGTSRTVQEQHTGFILRRGQYGEQFIENEYTIVGEVFSLLTLPTLSKLGWVKCDIETVKEALREQQGS